MDDILKDFVIETTEAIDVVDAELVRFEQEPNNEAVLAQIFRLVHTVKGTCGFLGLPRLEALAHASETVIGQFRDGVSVTTQAVSLILTTIDRIKLIICELEFNGCEPEGSDGELIDSLENMARSHAVQKVALLAEPEHATGALVYQVLERSLRPGEVSLDDLEMAFRDAPGPDNITQRMRSLYKQEPIIEREQHHEHEHEEEDVHAKRRKGEGDAPIAQETAASRQTLRVDIKTIDHLMTMVSELVLTRNQLLEIARKSNEEQFKIPLQRLSSITAELQETVMKTRMQPVAAAWSKLPRVVRDLCVELNKQIELETFGSETEIDRHVLDLIRDPLVHMIRNAADHGLEGADERIKAGKSPIGKIRVSALQEGGYIILEIADDGRGLNIPAISKRAIATGLATEASLKKMSESEIARFIFKPGFSTAAEVTSVSGRGVGMDVVLTNIEQAGGVIDVRTIQGQGAVVYIKIPVTLAIANALVVEACGQRFTIPQIAIVELVRAGPGTDIAIEMVNEAPVMRLRNELIPVAPLAGILKLNKIQNANAKMFVVICQVAERRFGVIVDSVVQTEEIVVKPTSVMLHGLTTYSGVTILGDGSVVMILDPAGMGRTIGVFADRRQDKSTHDNKQIEHTEPFTSLIVFRYGADHYRAVPLELVTRLEEIEGSSIEISGGQSIIQYRGKLMPLIAANGNGQIAQIGTHNVLVFTCGARMAGLVVDQIMDIVDDKLDISAISSMPGVLGSSIIGGRATDIIDVGHYLPFEIDGSDKAHANSEQPIIMIVDSSSFFRAMLSPIIKAAGYRVVVASDALSAFREMENCSPKAVIIDIETPNLNGFELATKLQAQKSDVQMIGLATRAGHTVIRKARDNGFHDLVGKFDRQGLIASLNDIFSTKLRAA